MRGGGGGGGLLKVRLPQYSCEGRVTSARRMALGSMYGEGGEGGVIYECRMAPVSQSIVLERIFHIIIPVTHKTPKVITTYMCIGRNCS